MLRRSRLWHAVTTSYVLAATCGTAPDETAGGGPANVVAKALAGDRALVV
jgi:hypothetical protein